MTNRRGDDDSSSYVARLRDAPAEVRLLAAGAGFDAQNDAPGLCVKAKMSLDSSRAKLLADNASSQDNPSSQASDICYGLD